MPSTVKTVSSHSFQLVNWSTPLAMPEVISRLNMELGKPAAGVSRISLQGATSKEDFQARVEKLLGPSGFMYFNETHFGFLTLFSNTPQAVMYVLGNPLIAQSILQHDLRVANNVPPRVLVLEKADGTGTDIIYHLPSSVMVLDDNTAAEGLKIATQALDKKLESLIERITVI